MKQYNPAFDNNILSNLYTKLTDTCYIIDLDVILNSKSKLKSLEDVLVAMVFDTVRSTLFDENRITSGFNALTEFLISKLYPAWFYTFRINPNNISISPKKMQTITEYGWGNYDLEHFGNALTTINVKGTSGLLLPPAEIINYAKTTDIRVSVAYLNFEMLKKVYERSTQRLVFTIMGKGYFGFFENFDYTLNAENPRRIDYSFTFKAHPQLVFDIFALNFKGELPNIGQMLDPTSVRLTAMSNVSQYGYHDFGMESIEAPTPSIRPWS